MEKDTKKMVVCPNCGVEQEYNPEFPYCKRCGLFLSESLFKEKKKISPQREALRGGAILLFLLFVLIFIFISRFYATIGMIFTVLIYISSFIIGRGREIKEKGDSDKNP